MRRVLFLSYYYPPLGGAGVQRSVKFVRYLPEHGYAPVVLTGPGSDAGSWAPPDESLAAEAPATSVLRVPTAPPPAHTGRAARAARILRRPPAFARWWRNGIAATARDAADVVLVYASMSPFDTAEAAAALARSLGRPWVADLRDPWALDEMTVYPSALHRWLEQRRMRRALASAAGIVMNTPEAARAARRALGWGPERYVEVIPNGFDAADFAGSTSVRSDAAFRIVHTGYFHTELALRHADPSRARELLGGTRAGVDFSGRTHMHLLTALERLIAEDPGLADRVELHLAGRLSAADLRIVERFAHRERVTVHGYLPHARSVELVRSADLLFFPMHDLPAGERSLIVPGKAYEYLASGRPVLAAVPDGDARDLMRSQAGVTVCHPLDVDGMAAVLRTATAAHSARPAPDVQRDLDRYERRHLTHRLAGVFDEVLGRRGG